jgi:hypothetical protein
MDSPDNFDLGLMLGILIGACLALLLVLFPAVGLEVLAKYQALIGGFIAAGGLYIAASNTTRQIVNSQRMENEKRSREFFAARVLMPHALTQLCDYAEECCEGLKSLISQRRGDRSEVACVLADFEFPAMPEQAIARLERVMQFCDNDKAHTRIAELVRDLQIQNSRLCGLKVAYKVLPEWICAERLADSLNIRTRCNMLYPFARYSTQGSGVYNLVPGEPTLEDLYQSLTFLMLDAIHVPIPVKRVLESRFWQLESSAE